MNKNLLKSFWTGIVFLTFTIFKITTVYFVTGAEYQSNTLQTISTSNVEQKCELVIDETAVVNFLTQTLQSQYCDTQSELELKLSRPWTLIKTSITNGNFKLIDGPGKTILPTMLVKFEWRGETNSLGPWQVVVYAKLWKNVIAAARPLVRGTVLTQDDITYCKRDILQLREWLTELPSSSSEIELVENIAQGQLIYPRSIRVKPILKRGQLADALHIDGALRISLKVEVLEDGAPGQIVKIKNPQTKRELRGKVLNDGTISICL